MDAWLFVGIVLLCIVSLGQAASRPAYYYNAGGPAIYSADKLWLPTTDLPLNYGPARPGTHMASDLYASSLPSVPDHTPLSVFASEVFCPSLVANCTVTFDNLDGMYELQLYLAEAFIPNCALKTRVFDIHVNGEVVLSEFDAYAEAGCRRGIMKSFIRNATDGLTITLGRITSFPSLKGLALVPLCDSPLTGELAKCPEKPKHPRDIVIKRDYGGQGDGDSWLSSNGEFQGSFPLLYYSNNDVQIDMSSPDLPPGVPMSLFQSHKISKGDLELHVPLPKEAYKVTLLFAEIRTYGPDRTMHIEMEGEVLLENYNTFVESGFNVAAAKTFIVDVEDGTLNIVLRKAGQAPTLCGLMIEQYVAGHEESFLHVVIDSPQVVIDSDSSGAAEVQMTGVISHTHEPGESLLSYFEWDENNEIIATTANLTTTLEQGTHRIGLTIFDTKTPSESLYDSTQVTVAPVNNVPGMLVKSYLDGSGTLPLDGHLGQPEAGFALNTALLRGPQGKETGRVYKMYGKFVVTVEASLYRFIPGGGESSIVIVNGALANETYPTMYEPGVYDLEVRFRVTNTAQWPLTLLREKGNGKARDFDLGEVTYDVSVESPLINGLTPKSGNFKGGQQLFISGLGFSGSDLTVEWSSQNFSTALTRSDLTISPLADEIRFVAPQMPTAGEVRLVVRTVTGVSTSVSYFAEELGALPVAFTEPKAIFSTLVAKLFFPKDKPTKAIWGPDGRLFVSTMSGKLFILTVDEEYNVVEFEELLGVHGIVEHLVLGLAFNPAQTGPDALYIAHGTINAQGGKCLNGQFSPYPGRVSILTAPNYDRLTPVITGLPVSNHDHSINGMDFDSEGNLYVSVGGNTNAGVVDCFIGELPESPLSGAILKAEVLKPGFNGEVRYVDRSTGEESIDQTFGDDAEVVPGVDISVFAPGFRNAYDLVFMQDGRLFAVDNGPNKAYGAASTGANTTGPGPIHKDEIMYVQEGNYYGHPNRNRGLTDPRQNVYYDDKTPTIPGVFEQCIIPVKSSSNGMDEYRSSPFNGALRGQLIVQLFKSSTFNVKLNPDGVTVDKVFSTMLPAMGALDVTVAPGGALLAAAYIGFEIKVAVPIVDQSTSRAQIYDIYPYRAAKGRDAPFIISGHGFSKLGKITVFIGGFEVEVGNHTDKRIYGQLPTSPNLPVLDLLDVEVVAADGLRYVYTKGIQFLQGKPLLLPPRTTAWEIGPSMPGSLGEVVSVVVDNTLFVMGQGEPWTFAYNLYEQEWLPANTYAIRPNKGHHHCIEVYHDKIYVIGGIGAASESKVQIFDPAANTWTMGMSVPSALASGSGNSVLHKGKIYYCGGIQKSVTINMCGVYDIALNTWDLSMMPMPAGRNHAAHVTDGRKMYVIGGRTGGNNIGTGFSDIQVYDFATANWTVLSDTGEADSFPYPRGGMGGAIYHGDSIYVFGGESNDVKGSTSTKVFTRVDIFNIATGKWREGETMPWGLHGLWPAMYNGKVYIPGGGVKIAYSTSDTLFIMDLCKI